MTGSGVQLQVHVDGVAGAPPVVFLHGITRSAATWAWAVPLLAPTHRVLRVDLRGHGASDRASSYLLAEYAADVVAVLEQVAQRPAVVVGHSLGGVVAAAVAQQRPELVTSLLLEDPALLFARPPKGEPQGPTADVLRWLRRELPGHRARGTAAAELADELACLPSPFGVSNAERYHDDALLSRAEAYLEVDLEVLRPVLEPPPEHFGPGFDIDAGLAVPTVVLAADLDAPDRSTSRGDEARLPDASVDCTWVRVPGGGHDLHDERDGRAVVAHHLGALTS